MGEITVFSHGSKSTADDDFIFVTRDLRLKESQAHTSQRVQFRYGPHYGSGVDMRISLTQAEAAAAKNPKQGLRIGGVNLLEIRHLEKFHLEIPIDNDQPATGKAAKQDRRKATLDKKQQTAQPKTAPSTKAAIRTMTANTYLTLVILPTSPAYLGYPHGQSLA